MEIIRYEPTRVEPSYDFASRNQPDPAVFSMQTIRTPLRVTRSQTRQVAKMQMRVVPTVVRHQVPEPTHKVTVAEKRLSCKFWPQLQIKGAHEISESLQGEWITINKNNQPGIRAGVDKEFFRSSNFNH